MSDDKQYPPMQQQQPQGPQTIKCEGCGGLNTFENQIADPKTGLTYQLHRCRDCGHFRWPDQK